jgi:hypothetical protein
LRGGIAGKEHASSLVMDMAAPLWENWLLLDLLDILLGPPVPPRGPNLLLLTAIFTQPTGTHNAGRGDDPHQQCCLR